MAKKEPEKARGEGEAAPEKAAGSSRARTMRRNCAGCRPSSAWCRTGSRRRGQRIVIVFEGRDAAGKGGTIRAITERCSPRVFRVVALPAPSDREKSQMYIQRYLPHFPAAGEVVIFDRSYYNRAGVERVLGFCTEAQHREFLNLCPPSRRSWSITASG